MGVGDLPGQHGALRPVGRDQPHQRGELGQQQPAHRRPGQVEQGVGRRQTLGVPALPHRCQHRRDGGADVVPQQHRDGSRKAQQAPAVRPGAGGYLLQLLPGATDAEIDTLEKNIAAMPSVTEMLRAGKTPKDMMELAMAGFAPQVLDERTVGYQCDCSEERTKGMLLSLGRRELVKMRDEDPHCEVVCHFCHSRYQYDLNDLIAEYDAQAAQRAAEEAAQNTNA